MTHLSQVTKTKNPGRFALFSYCFFPWILKVPTKFEFKKIFTGSFFSKLLEKRFCTQVQCFFSQLLFFRRSRETKCSRVTCWLLCARVKLPAKLITSGQSFLSFNGYFLEKFTDTFYIRECSTKGGATMLCSYLAPYCPCFCAFGQRCEGFPSLLLQFL